MNTAATDEDRALHALEAACQIVSRKDMQVQLKDPSRSDTILQDVGLPPSPRIKNALRKLIDRIEYASSLQRELPSCLEPDKDSSSEKKGLHGENTSDGDLEKLLLESFSYIRWSFWISLGMSGIIFLVGLGLLGIAISRFLTEKTVTTASLTIAGLGLADFLLLFYTRPWQDISANLANAHKIKIIGMSYFAGLTLVKDKNAGDIHLLQQLTQGSISLLGETATKGSWSPKKSDVKTEPEQRQGQTVSNPGVVA
jgi:hypothetical protein